MIVGTTVNQYAAYVTIMGGMLTATTLIIRTFNHAIDQRIEPFHKALIQHMNQETKATKKVAKTLRGMDARLGTLEELAGLNAKGMGGRRRESDFSSDPTR